MSYQDNDYEELIDRADSFMQKNRFHEAWECISSIPEDVKVTEFAEDCQFFASIALSDSHFDPFIRYFKVYFNTIARADRSLTDELTDLFFTMTTSHDSKIFPYVVKVINIILNRFRTPELLTLCASIYNMINMQEEAIPLLDEALDKDPFCKNAWREKAFSYHFLGDMEKEVECCNYYLALEPDCDDYFIVIPVANSLASAQQYEEAISMLKRVLGSQTPFPEHLATVHCLLAENYSALSDNKNELHHRQKALDILPEDVAYWSMLAQYYITSEDRPNKAEKIMTEAMVRFPDDPVMHYMYAAVTCQVSFKYNIPSKLNTAAYHIELAIRKIKDDILFLLLAARIFLLMKDYQTAIKYARLAYRLDPNNKNAILYMVLSTFGCGKPIAFKKFYRIYAKINPTARKNILDIIPDAESLIDKIEKTDK